MALLEQRRADGRPAVDDILAYLSRVPITTRGDPVAAGRAVDAPPPVRPVPDLDEAVTAARDRASDPMARRWRTGAQRRRRRHRAVLYALLIAGALVVVRAEGSGSTPGAPVASPYALRSRDEYTSLVAQAKVPRVGIFDRVNANGAPTRFLEHPTTTGAPLVFLVTDDSNEDWLRVQLPVRPNGTSGWIKREDVTVRATRYRVRVLLKAHRLELYDGAELAFQTRVAIGTQDTPTPGGRFFIKELIEPSTADTLYGNFVFGLSGFSNILQSFNGGEGLIGIHGTNDPSVIGRDVSRGCIRLTNEAMATLAARLPLGTPVDIVA